MRSVLLVALLFAETVLAGDEPIKVVTLGDSITRGVRPGVKTEDTFAFQLQKALAKEKINAEVVNVGIGGERTDQALKRLDAILKLKPKIVTIMYGTNDSYVDKGAKESRLTEEQYRKNLQQLVLDLDKAGVQVILMTEPRWGDKAAANGAGEHPNDRLERFMKVCRKVADETNRPLVDHFEHWTKQKENGIDLGAWTTDQCHPNARGHEEIAKLILPAVRRVLREQGKK